MIGQHDESISTDLIAEFVKKKLLKDGEWLTSPSTPNVNGYYTYYIHQVGTNGHDKGQSILVATLTPCRYCGRHFRVKHDRFGFGHNQRFGLERHQKRCFYKHGLKGA